MDGLANNRVSGLSFDADGGAIGLVAQRTLKSSVSCTGIALHSGDKVSMTLHPGDADSGVVFKRTDAAGAGAVIPASWDRVVETTMCTTLGTDDGVSIGTVEHLMAALSGYGIDNAVVELDGPEVPIMDGSAAPFGFLIECAGIREQGAPRRVIRVHKTVMVEDGAARAALMPDDGFSVGFSIDFDSPAVSRQVISVGLVNGTFKKEVARARTFGFLQDVERMRAAGLARGGSLDNAIVVSGDKILNEDGLRFDDEFVRHKVLDAIGDLYLAGGIILGRFEGVCSGHGTTNRLLRALFADQDAWSCECVRAEDEARGLGQGAALVDDEAGAALAAYA